MSLLVFLCLDVHFVLYFVIIFSYYFKITFYSLLNSQNACIGLLLVKLTAILSLAGLHALVLHTLQSFSNEQVKCRLAADLCLHWCNILALQRLLPYSVLVDTLNLDWYGSVPRAIWFYSLTAARSFICTIREKCMELPPKYNGTIYARTAVFLIEHLLVTS